MFSLVLRAVAGVLFYFGLQALDSFASTVERAVSGTPTDRSLWLYVGAAACGLLGRAGLVTHSPRRVQ